MGPEWALEMAQGAFWGALCGHDVRVIIALHVSLHVPSGSYTAHCHACTGKTRNDFKPPLQWRLNHWGLYYNGLMFLLYLAGFCSYRMGPYAH